MEKIVESFELYGKQYRLETGELAKQATGSVVVTQGDTTVLVTAVIGTTTSSRSRSTSSRRCTPSAASRAAI